MGSWSETLLLPGLDVTACSQDGPAGADAGACASTCARLPLRHKTAQPPLQTGLQAAAHKTAQLPLRRRPTSPRSRIQSRLPRGARILL